MKAVNLALLLTEAVQLHADRPALITDNQRITYRQLQSAVSAVARSLKKMGLQKGDKVAIMLPNIPEFVYSCFAVFQSGAVAVLLNTGSTPYELAYLLNNSDAKILVTHAAGEKRYLEIKDQLATCRNLLTIDPTQNAFLSENASDIAAPPSVPIDPDDPAVMIYTAGLTGKPLGAVLTHGNLASELNVCHETFRRTPDDIGLCLIPLFHSFGVTVNMLNVIQAGCSTVMMDRLTMDGLFSTMEREKVTYIVAVPRLYMGMVFYEKAAKYDLSSLKLCVTGGSAMPPDFIPVFEQKFNARILEGYGLTEAAPACSFNRIEAVAKLGSIGTALDGISMIVLTTAIVIPMIKQAGLDPIWFGIFLVLVVEMAEVSPPVGFNLFVLQTMSGQDSNFVALASLPFFFLLVLAVALITVFPDIVMVLPRMAFPG